MISLSFKLRFLTGVFMVIAFILVLISGRNDLLISLLMIVPIKVFQELRRINLTLSASVESQKRQVISDWALFFIFVYCIVNFIWFNIQRLLFCFLMYIAWFILWILQLLDKNIQNIAPFILHCFWIHMAILYTLSQPVLININISNGGLFWFIFPCSLVICNDITAYFCGKYFGKHKLLNLSPNKTIEGFIGATIITVLFGYLFATWLSGIDSLIENNDLVIYQDIKFHAINIALFASLAAPFGGFLASALKRASNIKDFGSLLPGHGGLTDRLDCQLFMAIFTLLYYKTIVS